MCKQKIATILFLISSFWINAFANEKIVIGNFSNNDLSGWESHEFKGTTNYELIEDKETAVVSSDSNASASGLIYKQRIDLYKTPFLNWRWKVENALYRLAETMKEGDDFAARIYIVKDGGVFFWNTIALNYVWASGQAKGHSWENPFSSNVKMLAAQSGDSNKQTWMSEKRNVREDLRTLFNRDIRFIDAIAIMTDTDNSGQKARAYFGDIYFTNN